MTEPWTIVGFVIIAPVAWWLMMSAFDGMPW